MGMNNLLKKPQLFYIAVASQTVLRVTMTIKRVFPGSVNDLGSQGSKV